MILDKIKMAVSKGAKLYANLSGGKDGQAMLAHLVTNGISVEAVVHCDLGKTEWPQSMAMCKKSADQFGIPLNILRRSDKRDMLDHWKHRMNQLQGTGKPFWSSSKNRYCTSDLKRDPSDVFYRNCGHNFIISAEGIRAQESPARAGKIPFEIRKRITSAYYDGMDVYEAIENYNPEHRLAITVYPVFDFSLQQVFMTYGVTVAHLHLARVEFISTGVVPAWWPFHAAYAMGNDRVSCMICIMGSLNDIMNGAKNNPELLNEMIMMEDIGKATFKNNWSLKSIIQ